ncbi:hypothetical protein Scep_011043 [Stephania cephalantha]|uniref:Leucine-rich repeat-containing N-terminal plant-type domain-containing protein n=1 Tax=Stephania cephalantha TaxID=152367 RepID=A0AAP0JYP8_9MAGN
MLLAFASLLLLAYHNRCYVSAATCHPDDESGLLAFKSGITEDPSGELSNWKPGTDCCRWLGAHCREGNNNRVTSLALYGRPDGQTAADNPRSYFTGTISPLLSKVKYLESIHFQFLRNLTGTFPRFIFDLPKLVSFSIEDNKLSGPLPTDIGRLSRLHTLSLARNRFSGSIPSSISQLTQLRHLGLGENLLSGPIPDDLRQLKGLRYLILDGNQLSGEIPNFWKSFPNLESLILSNNKFTGGIPTSIASLAPKLKFLRLGNNQLSGKIPEFISNLKALDTLDLSSNRFFGVLPNNLKNLKKIMNLNLARNNFEDPFPDFVLENIESLDLSYNKFKLGEIPKRVAPSSVIFSLKLAGCGIKMRLEDWKPQWTSQYRDIDLSDNEISGSAINLLNSIENLEGFWASGNQLKFNLSDIKLPKTLKYLDLSKNQVFGSVPQSVVGLEKLNLSYNRLCGKIPASKFPAAAFEGNACLCGSPLPACRRQ